MNYFELAQRMRKLIGEIGERADRMAELILKDDAKLEELDQQLTEIIDRCADLRMVLSALEEEATYRAP